MTAWQIGGKAVVCNAKPIFQLLAKTEIKPHLMQYPQTNLRSDQKFPFEFKVSIKVQF